MKISLKDLQELYKASISKRARSLRQDCPSKGEIIRLFRLKVSEKQKTKIIDHLTECPLCLEEFEFLLETQRYIKKLDLKIKQLIESRKSQSEDKKENIFSSKGKRVLAFFPRFSWIYASLAAGAVLILLAASFFFVKIKTSEKQQYRSIQQHRIYLIAPVNQSYLKSTLIFKWSEAKGSDYYIVEIFDETLFPFWKSSQIPYNYLIPSKSLLTNFKVNKTYFWMVTAFLSDGKKVESRLEEFKIRD